MATLEPYILELLVGGGLTTLAFFIRTWTATVTRTNEKILEKLDLLVNEFHEHKIEDATALSRIDADLTNIYKRLDREAEI